MKKVWIASDHAGFDLKNSLINSLKQNFEFIDLGCLTKNSVDYPDYANLVCEKIKSISHDIGFGVLICGSGQGMAMRANKFPWIRAALAWNAEIAGLSREHNNANVLCLGSRFNSENDANDFVQIFAKTNFAEGRHTARVAKVSSIL